MQKDFQFLLYNSAEENISVNAVVKDDTIWLTQKAMAELFGIDKSGISRHLKNIFETGELDENVVVAKFATTTIHGAIEGKTQTIETSYYNLDAIISVGYRVNIEDLIERENTFTMEEFAASVNEFLSFRRYDILKDKGSVSRQQALEKASREYVIFNRTQKIDSDFDKAVKELLAEDAQE